MVLSAHPQFLPSSLLSYAQSITWQGKQQDPTGFIHFGARYYDPQSGLFLSPDPISCPISLNLYSYANGDPINFHDTDGRFFSPVYKASPSTHIAAGILHGLTETVLDTFQAAHWFGGLATGGNLSEIERFYSHGRTHLEGFVVNQFSIDTQDSYYQYSRTDSRWVGNLAAAAKGAFSLGKMALMEGPALIRSGFTTTRSFLSELKFGKATQSLQIVPNARRAETFQGELLNAHLTQVKKYGSQGYRQLQNNKIRYYGKVKAPMKEGEMIGRRRVREWDPETGLKRTWHETLDENNNVRIVRPETNDGIKTHYVFDNEGNFVGVR